MHFKQWTLFFGLLIAARIGASGQSWQCYGQDAGGKRYAAIRQIDPERLIIVEGVHWASAKDLRDTLQVPPNDPNLIASFHMYAPMYFTHQGFSWMEPWYQTRGVTFPGPLPWEQVGFLADVAARLANAQIPFTSMSGFTTDHVLVRAAQAELAVDVLSGREPPPRA